MDIDEEEAAIGGLNGDVSIYSVEAGQVTQAIKTTEPVTDTVLRGNKMVLATSKGSIKVFERGPEGFAEVGNMPDHAGPVTGLALHPSGEILVSVGSDKTIIYYDMSNLSRAVRVYTDSGKTRLVTLYARLLTCRSSHSMRFPP